VAKRITKNRFCAKPDNTIEYSNCVGRLQDKGFRKTRLNPENPRIPYTYACFFQRKPRFAAIFNSVFKKPGILAIINRFVAKNSVAGGIKKTGQVIQIIISTVFM
jgi:hypothetical protein